MAKQADIVLKYHGVKYSLYFAGGISALQESSAEESSFNARFSRGKKRYGEDPLLTLAEFRDWSGGRGVKNFEDDNAGYYDGLAWTLTPGVCVPAPRWQFCTGLRTENRYMGANMSWKSLLTTQRYISTAFSASASYAAAHIWLFVKRVGAPGTLTLDLCPNVGGAPGTASKSVTKTITDITDYIDVYEDFAHASPLSMVSGTNYHLVVYGSSTDNGNNHWEIGVDRENPGSKYSSTDTIGTWVDGDYKMYYRITDAHVSSKYLFQNMGGNVYATSLPAVSPSLFYLFTNGVMSAAGGTTGLGLVTGRPCVSKSMMYFPQGAAAHTRYWNGATTWAEDTGNHADRLTNTYDATIGNQVAKSLGTLVGIAPATGAAHTFAADISCGDTTYGLTNMVQHANKLYILKQDEIGIVSGGVYAVQESNYKNTPSSRNGVAASSWNGLLYFSWLDSVMEMYGGTANDVGQEWRGRGPTGNRRGYASCVLGVNAWRFVAYDGGATGYSSVRVYTGQSWHEIYRAPYGHRIRDLWWQFVDGGASRLLIDVDYDVVYLEFPKDVANPINDTAHSYAHSFYITSPTFDDGAARLPKYIKEVTLSTTNCGAVNDTSVWFEIDYQTDNDVGEAGADHWRFLGKIYSSPEGTIKMNLGNRRCIRIRVRGYSDCATVPPQLDAITLDGFTRTPARTVWTMRLETGDTGALKKGASDLLKFLQELSTTAADVEIVSSTVPEMNGAHVIVTRPKVQRDWLDLIRGRWTGIISVSMMDMSA